MLPHDHVGCADGDLFRFTSLPSFQNIFILVLDHHQLQVIAVIDNEITILLGFTSNVS
jgi:hypothetical protein